MFRLNIDWWERDSIDEEETQFINLSQKKYVGYHCHNKVLQASRIFFISLFK